MTIRELYDQIGGSYEHAVQIMKKDKMIHKYLLKLSDSGVYENLKAAGERMDPAQLFEAGHAMKGVCANLGLTALSELSAEVCDDFRPGCARKFTDGEIKEKLAEIAAMFEKACGAIRRYEQEGQ